MASATYTLIASQTLVSSASSITLSSIPQTYTDLHLVTNTKSDQIGTNYNNLYVAFNGDSSTNYSSIFVWANGTTTLGSYLNNSTYFQIVGSDSSAPSIASFGASFCYIPNYSTTGIKQIATEGYSITNSYSTGYAFNELEANLYRGTSAITSISVTSASGNFIANSSFYLYGIKNS